MAFDLNKEREKLTNWLLETIESNYKDSIALVLVHDHLVLPTDNFKKAFDYFVPVDTPEAEAKANQLARTFIIHDIGLDLYPRSWKRLESMTRLEDSNTCILADARILYSRTPEDAQRFLSLQKQLRTNLQDTTFMYQKALEYLDQAMDLYRTMIFKDDMASLRLAAGYIANNLAISIACLNHTYLHNSQQDKLDELSAMPHKPEGLLTLMSEQIHLTSPTSLKENCYRLILLVRHFMEEKSTAAAEASYGLSDLADWYKELSYTWRRVRFYADQSDAQRTFEWGCYLQLELNWVQDEFGITDLSVLDRFDADDLLTFAAACNEKEKQLLDIMEEGGITISFYPSVDAFITDYEAI
ncbi:MAG: hypothetical protein IKL38_01920 [Firmicutes bacterium]|nr:hypothetical protein [Bacillota bacterium]